jgi:hypothetical protein
MLQHDKSQIEFLVDVFRAKKGVVCCLLVVVACSTEAETVMLAEMMVTTLNWADASSHLQLFFFLSKRSTAK